MKYAVIADIHANLEAFEVVLADAREQKCTHYCCVGDVVGYGANPKQCLDIGGIERRWQDLAGDAEKAYEAIWQFSALPAQWHSSTIRKVLSPLDFQCSAMCGRPCLAELITATTSRCASRIRDC